MENSDLYKGLTCYHHESKIRIGKENDGGYVVLDGFEYDVLIGCGVCDDVSFEKHFLQLHPQIHGHLFDGTIDRLPEPVHRGTYTRKNIGPVNDDNTTNLHTLIEKHDSVFLKMDIEGHEYTWFESLPDELLSKITQICIEFHFIGSHVKKHQCLSRLAEHYYLVHVHGNNFRRHLDRGKTGTSVHQNIEIPDVIECTYVHRDKVNTPLQLNTTPFPTAIDQPCNPRSGDIPLTKPPYVFQS